MTQCRNPRQPNKSVVAYTFPDDGGVFGWNAKYVVLCPRFFDMDVLTLEQQIAGAKKNASLQTIIDSWRKVKARSLFHESYHWGPARVSDPRCDKNPEVYDPLGVVDLAINENAAGARINAESWALAVAACYIMQKFNLESPPAPEPSKVGATDDLEEQFFNVAPGWFQSPISLDASSYVPVNDSDSDPDPGLTSGSTSISSSSSTPSTTPPPSPPSPPPPPASTQPAPPLESCKTQYKVLWDSFDIYGLDWDPVKLNAGGDANSGMCLLTQLRGCSSVTSWTYKLLTVSLSDKYQWHASGRTTIWQKNCIEHAVTSAGSPSEACDTSG